MNWFLIILALLIVALIVSPIVWLFYKAFENKEFQGDELSSIAAIKRLEMLESLNEKYSKS